MATGRQQPHPKVPVCLLCVDFKAASFMVYPVHARRSIAGESPVSSLHAIVWSTRSAISVRQADWRSNGRPCFFKADRLRRT